MTEEYERWRAQITRRAEAMEAASISDATTAIKSLLLLNGGAAVAILGFLSSTIDTAHANQARLIVAFVSSLAWFSAGAGVAVLTSLLAYKANSAYARALISGKPSEEWWIGVWWHRVATVAAFSSLICFACGVILIAMAYHPLP